MAGIKISVKNLPEFQATLRRYALVSKRTIPEICNKKALFIARGALWHTKKANKEAIRQELLALAYIQKTAASGKTRKFLKKSASVAGAPIAALLINWKRGQQGRAGLYGEAMKEAVKRFIGARTRTIAFIKSGWVPAIKTLSPLVKNKSGAKPLDPQARVYGKPKGSAKPATAGLWRVAAIIENAIGAYGGGKEQTHHQRALDEIGEPALEQAFADETKSMQDEIEKRLREAADATVIKHN